MTNSKARKSSTSNRTRRGAADAVAIGMQDRELRNHWLQRAEEMILENVSAGTTPTSTGSVETDTINDEDDEEDDVDSCSSFSLQECINEFRARRIRRVSNHSRDIPNEIQASISAARGDEVDGMADADLIDQNRTNKEQERKCKPCKNGFCYCFTSDSGDGSCGVNGTTRVSHVRQHRRYKNEFTHAVAQRSSNSGKEKRRQSAPASIKSTHKTEEQTHSTAKTSTSTEPLTAFSCLETTSSDGPLIHIIQELHNNCVISEVRVNKQKVQRHQRSCSLSSINSSPKKTHLPTSMCSLVGKHSATKTSFKPQMPTAPPLDKISEHDTNSDASPYLSALDTSSKSNESTHRKSKAAGRLLQKRLSNSSAQVKPRNMELAPPKPPRSLVAFEHKHSASSLATTSSSVREAERVIDEFLMSRGVKITKNATQPKTKKNSNENIKSSKTGSRSDKRKSFPLTKNEQNSNFRQPMPSCPSLSDIERELDNGKQSNYDKNIRQYAAEKPVVKEISLGWQEPKIAEMLNYDRAKSPKEFKSQATQAEPQVIGWTMPHKLDIDTVDGAVCHNLASNIENKSTPVKTRLFTNKDKRETQCFTWSKQLCNFSPWPTKNRNKEQRNRTRRNSKLTTSFLSKSKRKILRLVSPKKHNKDLCTSEMQKTPLRTIGVQTSVEDLHPYEPSVTPQSPPGSYHSAVQTSQQSTTPSRSNPSNVAQEKFDFSRIIQSPPKNKSRTHMSQRKLNFPMNCSGISCIKSCCRPELSPAKHNMQTSQVKSYKSYHTELDEDTDIAKMSYVLSNIRAKLEASDDFAVKTFQEVRNREQQQSLDCTDGVRLVSRTRLDIHNASQRLAPIQQEPLYSEIEEDSVHISGSPDIESKTGTQDIAVNNNIELLYAKVNKKAKSNVISNPPVPLSKILQESLKFKNTFHSTKLPPLYEPSSSAASYTSPTQESVYSLLPTTPTETNVQLCHSQSLNNIMEQHSPPKKNRNVSKSDLSLHRSEIFLENLCCSEIVIQDGQLERLEKVENSDLNQTYETLSVSDSSIIIQNDSVSYELPGDDICSNTAGSTLGLSMLSPQQRQDQSTPKKNQTAACGRPQPRTFITKLIQEEELNNQQLNVDVGYDSIDHPNTAQNKSNSCPVTPQKSTNITHEEHYVHSASLNEISNYNNETHCSTPNSSRNELATTTTSMSYKRLKNALRKSIQKSTSFVRNETKRLSKSITVPLSLSLSATQSNAPNHNDNHTHSNISTFNLDLLFAMDDNVPVEEQIAKTVSICRQLPGFEISNEMVEAERLLLFSNMRADMHKQQRLNLVQMRGLEYCTPRQHTRRFFIDGMRFPIKPDVCHDLTFNYFYIGTFECAGAIRSTQSVECFNHEAIFRDCGIEFSCADVDADGNESIVRCQIFMLRLRKVSTLSIDTQKSVKVPMLKNASPSSSMSSNEEVVSRFRLHANFTLKASDFMPYEYVESETKKSDKICLRASSNYNVPLTFRSKSTNLAKDIQLTARAEVRFAKQLHAGFLNVQDPHTLHNWNRRWCTLNGFKVFVWQDANSVDGQALFAMDLRDSMQLAPITVSPRELCARPRSFCLQCTITKLEESVATAAVFFTAETQTDLNVWLEQINLVLDFIAKWL